MIFNNSLKPAYYNAISEKLKTKIDFIDAYISQGKRINKNMNKLIR